MWSSSLVGGTKPYISKNGRGSCSLVYEFVTLKHFRRYEGGHDFYYQDKLLLLSPPFLNYTKHKERNQ